MTGFSCQVAYNTCMCHRMKQNIRYQLICISGRYTPEDTPFRNDPAVLRVRGRRGAGNFIVLNMFAIACSFGCRSTWRANINAPNWLDRRWLFRRFCHQLAPKNITSPMTLTIMMYFAISASYLGGDGVFRCNGRVTSWTSSDMLENLGSLINIRKQIAANDAVCHFWIGFGCKYKDIYAFVWS